MTELSSFLSDPCYHGSLTSNITSFRVGSHFGSRTAALGAAAVKYFESHDRLVTGRLYEVSLRISVPECVVTDDWGRPTYFALLAKLAADVPEFRFLKPASDEARAKMNDVSNYGLQGAKKGAEDFSLNVIREAVSTTGIKAVAYPNIVEGGRTTLSISVLDPAIIEATVEEPLSTEELADGAKFLSAQRQLMLQNRNAH